MAKSATSEIWNIRNEPGFLEARSEGYPALRRWVLDFVERSRSGGDLEKAYGAYHRLLSGYARDAEAVAEIAQLMLAIPSPSGQLSAYAADRILENGASPELALAHVDHGYEAVKRAMADALSAAWFSFAVKELFMLARAKVRITAGLEDQPELRGRAVYELRELVEATHVLDDGTDEALALHLELGAVKVSIATIRRHERSYRNLPP